MIYKKASMHPHQDHEHEVCDTIYTQVELLSETNCQCQWVVYVTEKTQCWQ